MDRKIQFYKNDSNFEFNILNYEFDSYTINEFFISSFFFRINDSIYTKKVEWE